MRFVVSNYIKNVYLKESQRRYDMQSPEIKEQLDRVYDIGNIHQLKIIKRTRRIPQKGDLFLVNPIESVYFYGKVISAGVNNTCGRGLYVIAIFRDRVRSLEEADLNYKPDFNNLLIKLAIVSRHYWTSGFFYTISGDNAFKMNKSYGFYSYPNSIVNENGKELFFVPDIVGRYGLTTIVGIAIEIRKEFIYDESLIST